MSWLRCSTMGSRFFAAAAIVAALGVYQSNPTGAYETSASASVSVSTSAFDPRRLSLADFADAEPE